MPDPILPPAPVSGGGGDSKSTSGRGASLLPPADTTAGASVNFGKATNVDINAYLPYMRGNGVNSDFNIDKQRAQNQHWYEQAAKTVGNAAANTITGIAEGFGYLPELFDSSHDYTNALTKQMQEWHNPLGQVYRENPNQTFDISDPAWWMENVQQLAESAAAFGLEGVAIGKAFGSLAKGAGELMSLNRAGMGMAIARGAAQTLTAGTLAYTEGAMSGYRIYDEVYKKNYQKALIAGVDPATADSNAKQTAGEAAATTVRMNTIMNTVLNLGEVAPLFKEPTDEALHWFKTAGKREEGESLSTWKKRLTDANLDNPELRNMVMPRHGINSRIAEAAKEGIEEVNTQYAEAEGRREGDGKNRNIFRALGDLDQYFKDVTDQEGALNFVLGAFGGVAQTLLIDHLPSRLTTYDGNNQQLIKKGGDGKVQYNKDGTPQYEHYRVSPKAYTERGTRNYFQNIKDAILSDIDNHQKLQDKLTAAVAKGDTAEAARIRADIFSITALDATAKGMTENWQEQYKQIGALDNTKDLGEAMQPEVDVSAQAIAEARQQQADPEAIAQMEKEHGALLTKQQSLNGTSEAMQKGFATDMKDDAYKERATQAVTDLKHLQEIHEHIQKKYVDHESPISGEVADHLFFRHANLYLRKQAIVKEEARIAKNQALEDSSLPSAEAFDSFVNIHNDTIETQNRTLDELDKDIAILQSNKTDQIKDLFSKYHATGVDENDYSGAIKSLVSKIQARQKLYKINVDLARKELEESTGYTQWKTANPNGTLKDYTTTVSDNALLQQDKANLQYTKEQHEIASQNLKEVTSSAGINQLYKDLTEQRTKAIHALNEKNKTDNLSKFFAQQTQEAADRLSVKVKEAQIAKLNQQLVDFKQQYNAAEQRREEIELQLKELTRGAGAFSNLNKIIPLRQELSHLKKLIGSLSAQIATAEHQLQLLENKKAVAEAKHAETVQKQEDTQTDETPDGTQEDDEVTDEEQENPETEDSQQTHYTPEELVNFEEPTATDGYLELKNTLSSKALKILDKLETEYKAGQEYSFDKLNRAFRPMLSAGEISQTVVNSLHLPFRTYLQEKDAPVQPATQFPVEQAAPVPIVEDTDIPAVIENEQPLIMDNAALFTEDGLENIVWEGSPQTTDAVKGTRNDTLVIRIPIKDPKTGTVVIRKRNAVQEDGGPKLNPDNKTPWMMIPGFVKPNHEVYLEIDTEYKGDVQDLDKISFDDTTATSADSFENYLHNGKIRTAEHEAYVGHGNVPIRVMDKATGQQMGWFPRVSWIREGNVADEVGEETGNIEAQREQNLAIRQNLAKMWNENPKARMYTVVTNMTEGRLMYHGDLTESTGKMTYKPQLANKLIPEDLHMGVATSKKGILISKGKTADSMLSLTDVSDREMARLVGNPDNPRTSVVMFVPMNNGKHMPVPLLTAPLSRRPGEINTVVRAIELYMQYGTDYLDAKGQDLINKINQHTGFDITTPAGLKGFVEQYFTLTNGFSDSRLRGDAEEVAGKKIVKWLIDIPSGINRREDGKADIKIGTTYSGANKALRADLKNGKLNEKFRESLIAGLSQRMKNVNLHGGNLRGLNSPGKFMSVSIDKNDVLTPKEHANYNAYVKSFVSTAVYGKHQIQGKYVYAVNGQMILDGAQLNPQSAASRSATELIATPAMAGKVTEAAATPRKKRDALNNDNRTYETVQHTLQPAGEELTVENLEKLYNFTPSDNRNGKTPEAVLAHLQSLGISTIADGYNPFTKC